MDETDFKVLELVRFEQVFRWWIPSVQALCNDCFKGHLSTSMGADEWARDHVRTHSA